MMNEGMLKAVLRFVMPPSSAQADRFKDFIASEYKVNKDDVDLELIRDTEILGGFILHVGEDEYDWSLKGRANAIRQDADRFLASGAAERDIISVIKNATDAHSFTARIWRNCHIRERSQRNGP